MSKKHTLDKLHEAMFEGKKDSLTEREQSMLERYTDTFTRWLDKPHLDDTQIRNYLKDTYGVSTAQAYRDITNVKVLLGNVSNAARKFQQYKVNTLLDRAAEAALDGDHAKAKSLTGVAKAYAYANRLNLPEAEEIPFDKIIPLPVNITDDPRAAGFEPPKNIEEIKRKLRIKYDVGREIQFTEICDDDARNRNKTTVP